MKFISLIERACVLIKIILKNNKPMDSLVTRYFRENKYIGSKERKFLSESVFSAIRIWELCEHIFELSKSKFDFEPITKTKSDFNSISNYPDIAIKFIISMVIFENNLFKLKNYNPTQLLNNVFTNHNFTFSNFLNSVIISNYKIDELSLMKFYDFILNEFERLDNSDDLKDISVITSTPYWILQDLINKYSSSDLKSIFYSCLEPASVCLRVNTMLSDKESLINDLNDENISTYQGSLSPDCVILENRTKVDNTDVFKMGHFEFQDEGSQLISYAVTPEQNWSVLDSCAGAGGKSLHLAILQNDYGKITAMDLQYLKLKELKYRAEKCGLKSIKIKSIYGVSDISKMLSNKLYDAVLVDAPCSGMGIIRRDPMRKYRVNKKLLDKLSSNQLDILTTYSAFVKVGGVLVYATCSLMTEENENVVFEFLKNNPQFESDNLYEVFKKNGIKPEGINPDDSYLTLRPDIHKTDGFFMARFVRTY